MNIAFNYLWATVSSDGYEQTMISWEPKFVNATTVEGERQRWENVGSGEGEEKMCAMSRD